MVDTAEARDLENERAEGEMLARIFEIVRGRIVGGPSGFERYFSSLQYHNGAAGPTREQARRDYLDMHRNG